MSRKCSVDACEQIHFCKGFCRVHFERWKRHGDPLTCLKSLSKRGDPIKWIKEHSAYVGEGCLIWPFSKMPDGRAHISNRYGSGFACRVMCEEAHGPAPSPRHEAAHSCGNGHLACIHPDHLRWATPIENAADKFEHGTVIVGSKHYASKLTEADVVLIRSLNGKIKRSELARQFGVKPMCINKIINRQSWRHVA